MKRIYLWWQNVKGTLLADLVLLFAVTLALFSFSDACAVYRYISLADQKLNGSISGDRGVYFMDASYIDPSNRLERNQIRMELVTSLSEDPSVRNVYAQASFRVFVTSSQIKPAQNMSSYVVTDGTIDLFPSLSRGTWFEEPVNEDGSLNVVIVGTDLWNIPIGTIIDLKAGDSVFQAKVCGVMYSPGLVPNFYSAGSSVTTQDTYSSTTGFVFGDCELTRTLLTGCDTFSRSPKFFNFFVEFQPDASEESIQSVLQRLSAQGGYQELSEIRENSTESLKDAFLRHMITPIFFVVIAFVAFFSISILSVLKRVRSYAVYYLLGFSKGRILGETALRMGGILFVAAAVNIVYSLSYRLMVMLRWIEQPDINIPLHDGVVAWIIAAVAVIMFLVTLSAVVVVLHKKSPAEVWRRSKE